MKHDDNTNPAKESYGQTLHKIPGSLSSPRPCGPGRPRPGGRPAGGPGGSRPGGRRPDAAPQDRGRDPRRRASSSTASRPTRAAPGRARRSKGCCSTAGWCRAIFDDLNPETRRAVGLSRHRKWDAERNTREFLAAMPEWREHGLLAFTLNLQGGSPQGYSQGPALAQLGVHRRRRAAARVHGPAGAILDQADELGMVVILGIFYFGQDERLQGRGRGQARRRQRRRLGARPGLPQRADRGQQRVQRPLRPRDPQARPRPRADRAGQGATRATAGGCWSAPATAAARSRRRTSSARPTSCCCTATASSDPARIAEMVRQTRAGARLPADADPVQRGRPLRLRQARRTTSLAAVGEYASWGYFDPGESNYRDGYQCPPVNWGINTDRKRAFFASGPRDRRGVSPVLAGYVEPVAPVNWGLNADRKRHTLQGPQSPGIDASACP